MKLFLDSAILEEIKQVKDWGLLDGVTTNPSLMKKAVDVFNKNSKKKIDLEDYIKEILKTAGKGVPVSLEVVGTDFKEMVREGKILFKKFNGVAKNVYVKIPVNPCLDEVCLLSSDGIKAIRALSKEGIPINTTLIFTPEQSLLAAKAGAKFVSPFVGREDDYIREMNRVKFDKSNYFPEKGFKKKKKVLEDNGIVSGVDLIEETAKLFVKQKVKGCEILAASIRNVRQFREVAEAGADIATLPFSVFKKLLTHHKTAEGMRDFTKDVVNEYREILRNV